LFILVEVQGEKQTTGNEIFWFRSSTINKWLIKVDSLDQTRVDGLNGEAWTARMEFCNSYSEIHAILTKASCCYRKTRLVIPVKRVGIELW
jgi:hypothetical protein